MKKIKPTNSDLELLIDDEDYERCNEINWSLNNHNYATGRWHEDRVMLHRFVLWMFDDDKRHVDHEDRNPLNCQKYNLRPCSPSQNHANSPKRKDGTSMYRGVHWQSAKGKWVAQIKLNKKATYLGSFDDERDAALAYDFAALQEFGEFAQLNFT